MNFSGRIRQSAQFVRHLPGVSRLDWFWRCVRPGYRTLLRLASGRGGVAVSVGGVRILVDPSYAATGFERIELASYQALQEYLRPGDHFYDVGAAIGCYTMVAARKIGKDGRIIALEPDPNARAFLSRHLRWNGIADQVTVRPVACSSEPGGIELFVSPEDVGGQASVFAQNGFDRINVLATSLDHEFAESGIAPRVVKIDVEGAEWAVLQGAQTLLKEAKPFLLLSIHPVVLQSIGITEAIIMEWLQQRGYECRVLERDHEVHVLAIPV